MEMYNKKLKIDVYKDFICKINIIYVNLKII